MNNNQRPETEREMAVLRERDTEREYEKCEVCERGDLSYPDKLCYDCSMGPLP